MKAGKVHLTEMLEKLPRSTTIGAVFDVTKGRVNFAPEEVDDLLANIEHRQAVLSFAAVTAVEPRNPDVTRGAGVKLIVEPVN